MKNLCVLSTGIIINLDAVAFIFPVGSSSGEGEDRGLVIIFAENLDNNEMMIGGPDAEALLKHLQSLGLDVKETRAHMCGPLSKYAPLPKAVKPPKKLKSSRIPVTGI